MREIEYREAIKEAVIEEMDKDKSVFLIGEDIGVYGGAFRAYKGLLEKYGPERVVNTPISEIGIIGAGVGAALTGQRPIAEIMFIDFTTSQDQVYDWRQLKCSHGDKNPGRSRQGSCCTAFPEP